MKVIATKKMQFYRADIVRNADTGELQQVIHESVIVSPSPIDVQEVPDWIRQDGLFELAVNDGALTVVGGARGDYRTELFNSAATHPNL